MDTQQVVDVYMQRPQELACLGLGKWFVSATGINDKEMLYSEHREAKRLLVSNCYLDTPGLIDQLKSYNRRFMEK